MEDSYITHQYWNIRRWADTISTPEGETIGRMEASPPESKDDILAMKAGTFSGYDRYYYLKDHLGSIRVTLKDNGSVAGYDDYYPFGLQMPGRSSNTANTHADQKFTGHFLEQEGDLGIYHAQARLYDPEVPRFYGVDAMRGDIPGWNPYHYTFNNPINYTDPDGNFPIGIGTLTGTIIGGIAGGVNAYMNDNDVLSGALGGATTGFVAGAVVDITAATGGTGTALLLSNVGGGGLGGLLGNGVEQFGNNIANGQSVSDAVQNIDGGELLTNAGTGLASGVLGGGASSLIKNGANNTSSFIRGQVDDLVETSTSLLKNDQSTAQVTKQTVGVIHKAAVNTAYEEAKAQTGIAIGVGITTIKQQTQDEQ